MAANRMLQLSLLVAVPTGHALHFKQNEHHRINLGTCSLEQEIISEIFSRDHHAGGCKAQSAAGVDFVSFVRKPRALASEPYHAKESAGILSLRQQEQSHVQRLSWGDGQGEGSLGDDCLRACGNKTGYCAWCGDGNACCRKGDGEDPAECDGVKGFITDGEYHECVEPLNPAEADISAKADAAEGDAEEAKRQFIVWVAGYPRSGSSTLLSMVSGTVDDNRAGGHTFSLFEPCHDGDKYDDWMQKKGCRQLLYGLSHCDFEGIERLWGWMDPHSTNNYTKAFDQERATKMCKEADIVAFKTVDWGHDLKKWKWLLDSRENMKVLDIVRDPRAIYASWKKLEPFKSLLQAHDFYTLPEICNHFARNMEFQDPRVHRIIFEDLMKSPKSTTHDVYEFLEQPFTSIQEHWLHKAFNAQECPPPAPGMKGFTDCHTFTGTDPRGDDKWRSVLTAEELATFENSTACQRVADMYKYPKK